MNKERIITIVISWLLVVINLFMILNFSLQDSEKSSSTSDNIVDSIVEVIPGGDKINQTERRGITISVRKLAHFGIYMLLGFTLINAMRITFKIKTVFSILISFSFSFAFSVFDEFFIQGHTQGRSPQWSDVLIDSAGAIVGVGIFLGIMFVYNLIINKRGNPD